MDARFREIQGQILTKKAESSSLNALDVLTTSEVNLSGATSTSKVANWRLFVFVVAFAIWLHEKIVLKNAENSRPQNLPNYRQMVYNYVDGVPLIYSQGQFLFDTTGVEDLEQRKIIKRCAILENNLGIIVKIATENNGVLEPVSSLQATRILKYLDQQTQPGVGVRLVNEPADKLRLNLTVYVDLNIIDLSTGKQLNLTNDVYPVRDAINDYLSNLEFDGAFVKSFFSTKIESATGVKMATINSLEWKYASLPFQDAGVYKVPNSGYFKIDDADLTITYLSDADLE